MKRPTLSLIIPTVGRQDALFKLLQELNKQSFKDFETILVFRAISQEQVKEISDKFPFLMLQMVDQRGPGLVSARNTGINFAKGKILAFSDDDVIPDRNWLKEIVLGFRENKDVGGLSGPTIIPDKYLKNRDLLSFFEKFKKGSFFWKAVGRFYISVVFENEPLAVGKFFPSGAFGLGSNYKSCLKLPRYTEVMDLQACNLAVRKNVAQKLKGFDPAFSALASYSESDFAFRIRESGLRLLFNPKAIVYHTPSKAGVFRERVRAKTEMENFLLFYFRHIKFRSINGFFKFLTYLFFIIVYRGIYQSMRSASLAPLFGTVSGTFTGFIKAQTANRV